MLNAGQTIAHFKILRKLGEGGMGAVYLAEDQKLNRQVALKVLTEEYFGDTERKLRFQREARTAAQITHPNVMAIYDIGVAKEPGSDKELSYIVMEYVEGISLGDYLKDRRPDLAETIRLAEKIASGLAAAHRLNIVHRDIKLENIIINTDGEPKILDFGLAKPLEPVQFEGDADSTETVSQQLTKAGKIVGTVSYMSPEQAQGKPVDIRSDIFSFGVLLYRMVTGKAPFAGGSQVSTLAKILETKHESPRLINEDIPAELERIIDKCLQKDPADRYQDTRDLVVDLRNLRRQYDSSSSDSISLVGSAPKEVKKMYTFTAGWKTVAIVLIILIGGFVGWKSLVGKRRSDRRMDSQHGGENSLAILSFENKTGDSTLNWLETGLPEILVTDLAQSQAINLISREHLLNYLHREKKGGNYTRADMNAAARAMGAGKVLTGSLYKLGDKIRIDARMEEISSGNIVLATKVVGEDAFSLVDSLTEKIAQKLNLSEWASGSVSVADLVTTSPEAYRLYHEGMKKFEMELWNEAIEKFNQAIQIDSNFALAYMRLGMANQFRGHIQVGAKYFAIARQHKDRLPPREKSLFEVYAGFWLDRKFDDAIVRLKSYVDVYPDDKEGRTIYALVLNELYHDTTQAFAQLDTALLIDPHYQLALSTYATIYESYGKLDETINYVELIRRYHPESPSSYLWLAGLYASKGKIDKAIEEYHEVMRRFPANSRAFFRVSRLYIMKREFDKAKEYLERVKEKFGDDPYLMGDYYGALANLEEWHGKFKASLRLHYRALEQAYRTNDSAVISNELSSLFIAYRRYEMPDSAAYYARESYKWAISTQRLSFPLRLVSIDSSFRHEAEPLLNKLVEDLKAQFPSEMWSLTENVEKLFHAYAQCDTAALIEVLKDLAVQQNQLHGSNMMDAGIMMALTGRYQEGLDVLEQFVSGPYETTNAYRYFEVIHARGVANEGLGNIDKAIENYREVLRYWGKPDIELKIIKDTRKRLANLTS